MLPQWLNPNHFLSSFLCQASWFRPVWSKLEAITSGSREITSLYYVLWLIFHNTASSFKVLTETLNTKASVTDEQGEFGMEASSRRPREKLRMSLKEEEPAVPSVRRCR